MVSTFGRGGLRTSAAFLASVVATFGFAAGASAQFHGIQIGKNCTGPKCVGEMTDCSIFIGHADGFGDTIELLEAWDVIDPLGVNVRVPAVGNLPIVSIQGNAFCTDSGGICDQSLGVNCALPCRIGPSGSTLSGLPGDPQAGFVVFRQNQYTILPGDPSPLLNQANIRYRDLCDSPTTSGCSSLPVTSQFTAATTITQCPDETCATGMCVNGVCSYEPDCVLDTDCTDDGNVCTTETCVPVPGGPGACCESIPECLTSSDCVDDGNPCTLEFCTPEGCCDFIPDCTLAADCDDMNVCTTDTCDNFCCVNTPECLTAGDCVDDGNPCTTEICTPDGCCDVLPDCTVAADCDDMNVCSTDTCNNFCCVNTRECLSPMDCVDDGNVCTAEFCTPDGCCDATPDCTLDTDCNDQNDCTADTCENSCCVFTPGCVTAADCNDNDACTSDACANGCCQNIPVFCNDQDPCTADTCDGQAGCVYTAIDPPPASCVTIPTVSEWGMAILALLLAIGGKLYFGRREAVA